MTLVLAVYAPKTVQPDSSLTRSCSLNAVAVAIAVAVVDVVVSGTCIDCCRNAARQDAAPPSLLSSSSINGAAAITKKNTKKIRYPTRKDCSDIDPTPFTMPLIRSRELIAASRTGDTDGTGGSGNEAMTVSGNEGEIDQRSVFWLASSNHRYGERCKNCPNCVCLSVMRTLTQIATHPCLLQVDFTKHSLVDSKDQTKKEFLEKAIPEDLLIELGGAPESS